MENPGIEPSQVEGTGEPTTGTGQPEEGSASGQSVSGQKPNDEYLGKIYEGGDFAVQQIRDKDRRYSSLEEKSKTYKPLDPYVDQLGGGEGVLTHLQTLSRLKENPQVWAMNQAYLDTGALPTGGQNGSDPSWDEPEDPRDTKIAALESEIQQIKAGQSQIQGNVGLQRIEAHLGTLKDEFPDAYDEYVEPFIREKVDAWKRTPNGLRTLAELDIEGLRALAYNAIGPHMTEIGRKRYERDLEEQKRMATDGGVRSLTTGRESTPRPSGKRVPLAELLAEAKRTGEIEKYDSR